MFKSISGVIGDCETQICWNGIDGVLSNGSVEEFYAFVEALRRIGSTQKLAILEDARVLLESAHGRPPTDDEIYEVTSERSAELNGLDKRYFDATEDLEALVFTYASTNPDEVALARADAGVGGSELATKVVERYGSDATGA